MNSIYILICSIAYSENHNTLELERYNCAHILYKSIIYHHNHAASLALAHSGTNFVIIVEQIRHGVKKKRKFT